MMNLQPISSVRSDSQINTATHIPRANPAIERLPGTLPAVGKSHSVFATHKISANAAAKN